MPWEEIKSMDLKVRLVSDWKFGDSNKTDLSKKYGVSRKTIYKWLKRYDQLGIDGLKEQSRAPKSCPHRISEKILSLIIQEKLRKRNRGPKKIKAQLQRRHTDIALPAVSTISYWLKKKGLVQKRKKRLRVAPYSEPFSECNAPNAVWSIDYKGQFWTRDKRVCYPLTISDNFSRYLLDCRGLEGPRYDLTKEVLISAFREYGLPDAIRTDNGVPFAGKCVGGLSRLSIWWIRLGIKPERIEKGCPQQNGRHERMHRTLKADAVHPIAGNLKEQQGQFDLFRQDYNNQRPHEALGQKVPDDYYYRSIRSYVEDPPLPEYERDYAVRQVRQSGGIKFTGRYFFISELLIGHPIGLKEIADGIWQLYYSFYALGLLDLRKNKIIRNQKVLPIYPVKNVTDLTVAQNGFGRFSPKNQLKMGELQLLKITKGVTKL